MTAPDYRLMARQWLMLYSNETHDGVLRQRTDQLTALLERVAQDARPRWETIETYKATRVFESVMVATKREYGDCDWTVGEAYYRPEEGEWWWVNQAPGDFDPSDKIAPEPTHWQPLPTPPTPRD